MTSAMKPALRAGFTLIELMIVMCIIGILTSVAYPYFTTIKLKARRAERLPMLRTIEKTLFQIVTEKDTLVRPCGSGCTCVDAPLNPPFPVDGNKHPFNPALGDWQQLGFSPDGWLYYRYSVSGNWCPAVGTGSIDFHAEGDLDADGVINFYDQVYTLSNNTWTLASENEAPPNSW